MAKELSEPTPNFIVVYDLQSGTLFKKWKPSCNTVSLAISQANTCVIAGLEDARILIWDLVTGNCRCTLFGHNAPVTLLKLDPLGKTLLSGDKEGRDKSIRLWNLNAGMGFNGFFWCIFWCIFWCTFNIFGILSIFLAYFQYFWYTFDIFGILLIFLVYFQYFLVYFQYFWYTFDIFGIL